MQTRTYATPGLGAEDLAHKVRQWFSENGYETQILSLPNGSFLVQGYRDEIWQTSIGLAAALTVQITEYQAGQLEVTLGEGAWGDKLLVAGLGLLFFLPLVLTAAFGTWQQYDLDKQAWTAIEAALPDATLGELQPVSAQVSVVSPTGDWFDETTGEIYSVQFFQRLESWQRAMADGQIDGAEIQAQSERVQQLLKKLEPTLTPDSHSKLTEALGELSVLQGMQSYSLFQKQQSGNLQAS